MCVRKCSKAKRAICKNTRRIASSLSPPEAEGTRIQERSFAPALRLGDGLLVRAWAGRFWCWCWCWWSDVSGGAAEAERAAAASVSTLSAVKRTSHRWTKKRGVRLGEWGGEWIGKRAFCGNEWLARLTLETNTWEPSECSPSEISEATHVK